MLLFRYLGILTGILFSLCCGQALFGQSLPPTLTKDDEPIIIKAEQLDYNSEQRVATYLHNVVVTRGNSVLYADKMSIYLSKKNKIVKIIADGNVKIVDGPKEAHSQHAEYYDDQQMLILMGEPTIQEGNNILKSDRIKFFVDTYKVEAEGNVETVYVPKSKNLSE